MAGYPKLFDKNGAGTYISKIEATLVNDSVSRFNDVIESIVDELRATGVNICFVDVEAEFDKDGGHQVDTPDAWINDVMLRLNAEDLDMHAIGSSYSVHPNVKGAEAYARCVNAKIEEIENREI